MSLPPLEMSEGRIAVSEKLPKVKSFVISQNHEYEGREGSLGPGCNNSPDPRAEKLLLASNRTMQSCKLRNLD